MTNTMTETVTTAPVVGTRYRINTENPYHAQLAVGVTVEVTSSQDHGENCYARQIGENDTMEGLYWYLPSSALDPLDALPLPIVVGCRVRYVGNTIGEYMSPSSVGKTGVVFRVGTDIHVTWDDGSDNSVYAYNVVREDAVAPRVPVEGDLVTWTGGVDLWRDSTNPPTADTVYVVGRVDESDNTFVVTRQSDGLLFTWLTWDAVHSGWDTNRLAASWSYHSVPEAFVPDVVPSADLTVAQERIAELERINRTQQDAHTRFRASVFTDMSTLSEILINEANSRNWCSEFDDIEERINGRMTVLSLDSRNRDWSCSRSIGVDFGVLGTVYVTQTGSYSGSEPDEDDVEWNEVDDYDIRQALTDAARNYSFSLDTDDCDISDFECEQD